MPLKDDAGTRRFNIALTDGVLPLVAPREQVEPRFLRWGLVPSWSKDLKGAQGGSTREWSPSPQARSTEG